jgi:four helix bundle protein
MNAELLKSRMKKFAIEIAVFCEDLPNRKSLNAYTSQLIRSSSSVGANYRAACRAKSTADFINKLKIVEEESDESIYFLELIKELHNENHEKIDFFIKEADEFLSIVVASIKTLRNKK